MIIAAEFPTPLARTSHLILSPEYPDLNEPVEQSLSLLVANGWMGGNYANEVSDLLQQAGHNFFPTEDAITEIVFRHDSTGMPSDADYAAWDNIHGRLIQKARNSRTLKVNTTNGRPGHWGLIHLIRVSQDIAGNKYLPYTDLHPVAVRDALDTGILDAHTVRAQIREKMAEITETDYKADPFATRHDFQNPYSAMGQLTASNIYAYAYSR